MSYIVRCEKHRIPQSRHRLILVGIRNDIASCPRMLRAYRKDVPMSAAIGDLPRLRSMLSKGNDSGPAWVDAIRLLLETGAIQDTVMDDRVQKAILTKLTQLTPNVPTGDSFIAHPCHPRFNREWFYDPRLGGVCNHTSRSHMQSDLWRYFFAACYAAVHKESPKLPLFPAALLPNHANVTNSETKDMIFKDRFRVQVSSHPASTVTSHIGKDGHYFIHPDPLQCRSLTVREAARIQSFPDNYYFSGPITKQYQQVGNAVPPLLARQLAALIAELFA